MIEPYVPKNGWSDSTTERDKKKIQKRYAKNVAKGIRKHALPVAAGTAGIMRGIARSAEVSLDEKGIRETQGVANRADANLTNVLNESQLGPFSRLKARAVVRKNVRAGLKEGGALGKALFKSPGEMRKTIRRERGR
jgi:hypothetical protein